jgi:uncharacterized membrane protein
MRSYLPFLLRLFCCAIPLSSSFRIQSPKCGARPIGRFSYSTSTQLHLFEQFGKVFEESGPLGKGITVGKVQVALQCKDRSGIFRELEQAAATASSSGSSTTNTVKLAQLANSVCLALLRKSDDWTAACSMSKWFSQNDAGKAESLFNDMSNREAAKFEKEYIPDMGSTEAAVSGGPTICVVSVVVELQGDQTKFDGAGFSLAGTRDVLTSVASDVLVERGACVNAVEVFWTPSERSEVLSSRDVVYDFPELIDL